MQEMHEGRVIELLGVWSLSSVLLLHMVYKGIRYMHAGMKAGVASGMHAGLLLVLHSQVPADFVRRILLLVYSLLSDVHSTVYKQQDGQVALAVCGISSDGS